MQKCKTCGLEKHRVRGDLMRCGKRFYYVDSEGGTWNGKTCPSCNLQRCKENMQKARDKKKLCE